MDLQLAGKHLLVTGASRGLGRAVVAELLRAGSKVTVVSRQQADLASANLKWKSMAPNAELTVVSLDLSDPNSIATLSETLQSEGRLDGLIQVAGSGTPSSQSRLHALGASLESNVHPTLVSMEAAAPLIRKSDSGSIVLISSIAGKEYLSCPPEYAASKSMLSAYAAHWARELEPVRVNVLAPGNMLTDGSVWQRRLQEDPEGLQKYLDDEVALRRLAQPEEIAKVAVFMSSSAASFMTGTTVVVDGGQTRQW